MRGTWNGRSRYSGQRHTLRNGILVLLLLAVLGFAVLEGIVLLGGRTRVAEGDVLSIRGHGKYIIDRLGPLTQKGRLSVQCRKYE